MFDPEFYPTPRSVIESMLLGVEVAGKVVLEPQAGKGNIIEALKERGAHVIACEKNEDLAIIASQKADEFIEFDFFGVESGRISHVDFIIMNPPFKNADEHILHAYEIAPEGCEIVALCNYQTIENRFSNRRAKLYKLIEKQGSSENLGDVFSDAERTTGIEIGLVRLNKPRTGDDEFADFLFSDEEEVEVTGGSGVMQYSKIRDIVGRYIQGVKMYDSVMGTAEDINGLIKPLGGEFKLKFNALNYRGSDYLEITRDTFKKELQKSAWHSVFNEMKMDKYITKSVKEQLNKFVEQQSAKPFTMKNIFAMIELIVGTHSSRIQTVIEETFDWLTKHHSDNRHSVEGWKTNSMYMVNKKFIAPYCGVHRDYSGNPEVNWGARGADSFDDLTKALCLLTGKNYNDQIKLYDFFRGVEVPNELGQSVINGLTSITGYDAKECEGIHNCFRYAIEDNSKIEIRASRLFQELEVPKHLCNQIADYYKGLSLSEKAFKRVYEYKEWGKWYEWNFFEIKVFKKGTLHAKFKDDTVWEMFNKAAVKAKGWQLPTKTGSDVRRSKTGVEVFSA